MKRSTFGLVPFNRDGNTERHEDNAILFAVYNNKLVQAVGVAGAGISGRKEKY